MTQRLQRKNDVLIVNLLGQKSCHVGDIRTFQPRCMILIEKQSFKQEKEKKNKTTNSGLPWGSSGLLQKPVIKKPSTTLRELENSGLLHQRA